MNLKTKNDYDDHLMTPWDIKYENEDDVSIRKYSFKHVILKGNRRAKHCEIKNVRRMIHVFRNKGYGY